MQKNIDLDQLHIQNVTKDFCTHIIDAYQGDISEKTPFIPFTFNNDLVQFAIQDLRKGNLCVIAGRPCSGKSALIANIIYDISVKDKLTSLVFSIENSRDEEMGRLFNIDTGISNNRILKARLDDEDWVNFSKFAHKLAESNIYLDNSSHVDIDYIEAVSRQIKEKGELDVIIIDYIQLLHKYEKNETRASQIAEFTRRLKSLAKELNCCIIAVSQLNRSFLETTEINLSTMRDSGSIEEDADRIIVLVKDDKSDGDYKYKSKITAHLVKTRSSTPILSYSAVFDSQKYIFENHSSAE